MSVGEGGEAVGDAGRVPEDAGSLGGGCWRVCLRTWGTGGTRQGRTG